MAKLSVKIAQDLLDLLPRSTFGLNKDVDEFLQQIHAELDAAVARITSGQSSTSTLTIRIYK
jgi:hypothetical protein